MGFKAFLELSDFRNVFRAKYWKTGLAFWPIHLYSVCLLLYLEVLGFMDPRVLWPILLPVNVLIAGGWMLGNIAKDHPKRANENFWMASGKFFLILLVPSFSLTFLLAVVLAAGELLAGVLPEFSVFTFVLVLVLITSSSFLFVSLFFVPYGVAVHRLYPKPS